MYSQYRVIQSSMQNRKDRNMPKMSMDKGMQLAYDLPRHTFEPCTSETHFIQSCIGYFVQHSSPNKNISFIRSANSNGQVNGCLLTTGPHHKSYLRTREVKNERVIQDRQKQEIGKINREEHILTRAIPRSLKYTTGGGTVRHRFNVSF